MFFLSLSHHSLGWSQQQSLSALAMAQREDRRKKSGRQESGTQEQHRRGAPNDPDCLRNFRKSLQSFELTQVFLDFILHWFNTKGFSGNTFSLVILHKEPVFVVLKLRNSERACLLTSIHQTRQQNLLLQWSPGEPRMRWSTQVQMAKPGKSHRPNHRLPFHSLDSTASISLQPFSG